MSDPSQPSLFPEPEPGVGARSDPAARDRPGASEPPGADPSLRALSARLPDQIRFGTSSWSFPGWAGLVYARPASPAVLARDGLREYAAHPLFRTVGIDRGYYAPVPEADLRRYASQLPPGFLCCLKAPAAVTSGVDPAAPRGGAAPANPLFLSAELVHREVLEPCARAFAGHLGALIFAFPPVPAEHRLAPADFVRRLDTFLGELPAGWPYAVEIRDRRLLTPEYASVLARRGAAHVYNYWSGMPTLTRQAEIVPPEQAGFTLSRLLLAPGTRYEARREAYRPFDRLVDPDPAMREEVMRLLDRACRARQPAFILVNNKAEGSSPLTIRAIVDAWVSRRGLSARHPAAETSDP